MVESTCVATYWYFEVVLCFRRSVQCVVMCCDGAETMLDCNAGMMLG
jgi:hypothetical protein